MRTYLIGRVEWADSTDNLFVELRELGGSTGAQRETVAPDGTFHFREIPAGSYEVRVVAALNGETLLQEFVEVSPLGAPLVLRLPRIPQARPVSGIISVRQLQSRVPKKAFQAFVRAQHYTEAAKPEEAMAQLRRAIAIDPDWCDPHVNLGVHLLRAGRYPEALAEFDEGVRIGPASAMVYTNYAAALAAVSRPVEAEKAVREALRIEPGLRRAHYLLGHMLAMRGGQDTEALDQLRTGAPEVPAGRIVAAQVLLRSADRTGAAAELRAYLQSGDRGYREQAQQWLKELEP